MTRTRKLRAHALRIFSAAALTALASAWPCAAQAQATLNPYVSAQFEHDSNVFRVENSRVAQQFYGGPQLADTDFRYIAGVEGTYLWGIQKLTGTVEGREIRYDHFTFLDHSEYLANLQLDWKVASVLDGIVQVRQEHLAAYFADSNSPYLEVDTDRNVVGKLNFRFRTDWRLETGVNFRNFEAPLQFFPDFVEHQTGSHLGLSYLGLAYLSYGISFDRIDGKYDNAPGVGPYTQNSVSAKANYAITGLQTLSGALGYTKRTQTGGQSYGGITGQLKYVRQLTAKTSVNAQFTRAVNSYIASAGSEVDTTESVGVTWQATYKLAVNLNAAYVNSTFIGQIIPGSTAAGRTDHSPYGGLNVTYQILRQLQVKGYFNAQSRKSNSEFDRYNDTTAGIQLLAHWR